MHVIIRYELDHMNLILNPMNNTKQTSASLEINSEH